MNLGDKMITIEKNDLKFIAEKTRLAVSKVKSLTEEERDVDLLLNEICLMNLGKDDQKRISFPIYCKLVTYKISAEFDFSSSDKAHVAESIAKYHQSLKKAIDFKIFADLKKPSPEAAQYLLVLSGLHKDKLKVNYFSEKHEIFMNEGFRKAEKLEIGHNIIKWVNLLRQAKTEGWFR